MSNPKVPPVDRALLEWLESLHSKINLPPLDGEEAGAYALRCAVQSGKRQVIDQIHHLLTKQDTRPLLRS